VKDHAADYPAWDEEYAERLVGLFEIKMDRKLSTHSKGEKRRVQLLMALAHRPPLLLLDEPTDGLDPFARDTVVSVLAEHLAASPTTVIASTHLVDELDGLADHLGVLKNGKMVAQLRRSDLEMHLHTYSLELPEGWNESVRGQLRVIRENGRQREREWTVWGEAGEVARSFDGTGARVRAIHPVSLREVAVALIGRRDGDA
jgi:ABC-2 type transport system ATP-binding protein